MLYILTGDDVPNSAELRAKVRAAHLARLDALQAEGRLVLAGPIPSIDALDPGPAGFAGSLILAEFDSMSEAEAWLAEDPYMTAGVFATTRVRPFNQVFPR